MLLCALRAERIKRRHAPVFLAFFVLPLFPAVLGTANYLANLSVLDDTWYSLWTQHTLFASTFFLPALLGVFCAWQWHIEQAGHNLNAFLTMPVPVGTLYLSKLIPAAGMACLVQAVTGALFVLSGFLAGIREPVPPELFGWLLCGAMGGTAVCAVQLYVSLVLRSFAVPVAIALVGGIAGLMLMSRGVGMVFPYSLLCLGMRANNPNMEIDVLQLALACAAYTLLFSILSVHRLKKRDAGGE